jgi:anti-sigma B factor antagonist
MKHNRMAVPEPSNVLALEGQIDFHVSSQIAASLGTIIEQKPARLVVDLSRVSYIDSSGLATLIHGTQNVETYGGRFMLAGMQEDVRTILETAGLANFFLSFPHVDAALAAT